MLEQGYSYESIVTPRSREELFLQEGLLPDTHDRGINPDTSNNLLRKEYTEKPRKVTTYDVDMDIYDFQDIYKLQFIENDTYAEKLQTKKAETAFNLQTMLGERYDVELSRFSYDIRGEKIYGKGSDEPFETVLERGIQYRKLHGNQIDHDREQAEADGFAKIQKVLADDTTPEGTVMLSMSPPGQEGSQYKKRFIDMFVKRIGVDGTPFVEAIRKSVSLEPHEFIEKFIFLSGGEMVPNESAIDAFLLSHPITLTGGTPESIHRLIQGNYASMRSDHFKLLLQKVHPEIDFYITSLIDNPFDLETPKYAYNALLVAAEKAKKEIEGENVHNEVIPSLTRTREEILYMAAQPIASLDTGCGISEGYAIGGYYDGADLYGFMPYGPFSVFDYGVATTYSERDANGPLEFRCPNKECNALNKRPYGGWVYDCIRCGADVSCGRRQKEEEAKNTAKQRKTLEAARQLESEVKERAEMERRAELRKQRSKEKERARRN